MEVSLLDEVQGAQFGDKRLDRRLGKVIEELGAHPNLSIPAATDSRAEMEGAYRFFDNDKVSPEEILQPHFDATRDRISQTDFALLVQDTSEINLTRPNQQVQGAGPMDSDARRGSLRRGSSNDRDLASTLETRPQTSHTYGQRGSR